MRCNTTSLYTYIKLFCLLILAFSKGFSQGTPPCDNKCIPISLRIVPANYQIPPKDTTQKPVKKVTNIPAFDSFLNNNLQAYDNNVLAFVCNDTLSYTYQNGQYNADDILPIASATKWLTAAVIMSLVDDNKLNLNDKIGSYLPIFNTYGKGDITIRQIFSHTSGFQADTPYDDRGGISLQAAVDSIAIYSNLQFSPGTQASYGSSAYKIAARIAEVIEGKLWENIFKERIANKCEMSNTSYLSFINNTNPHAGAGVRSTMNDYIKFLTMIHNFGIYKGQRVLSENSVKTIELDQSGGINTFYGLGVWRYQIVSGFAQEVSSPSAMGIHPWINRDQKYFGIIFTQAGFDKTINTNLNFRSLVQNTIK